MKKINNYFKSYNGSDCRLDFLRFGLFNERGSFIDTCPKKITNLEELNEAIERVRGTGINPKELPLMVY